jgi:anti-anti-sigma factor
VPGPDITAPPVAISSAPGDGIVIVEGDLDVGALPVLTWHLARVVERKPRILVFDLARTSFLDCAAAHAIMEAARALPGRPRPVLLRPPRAVSRLLSLTGLDKECVIQS